MVLLFPIFEKLQTFVRQAMMTHRIGTNKMTTEFSTIKTDKLLLRQFVESDIENVFKGLSHPDIIK